MRQHFFSRVLLGVLLTIAGINAANCQNPDPITSPTVIPPSPEAQSFIRYGEIPVDYSTGVPKIEVPIYEIKSGKLSLPISLSYHASGIRVNDISGVAGLGWRLNAGGVLTRTVKGRADDTFHGMLTNMYYSKSDIDNAPLSSSIYYLLEAQSKTQTDNQSDNYYYSAGNDLSGQFIYDHGGNLVPLVATTDKIIKHAESVVQGSQFYYEIIKDDGTRFIFDQQEVTLYDGEFYASSWWLSKIISADGADVITFEYQHDPDQYVDREVSQSWTFGVNSANLGETGLSQSYFQSLTNTLLLTKINFNNGYLQFNYSSDRLDMRANRLTSIGLYSSATSTLLKQFQLDESYFNSEFANNKFNYRLKLDGLEVLDGSNNLLNKQGFSYDLDNILPPYLDAQQNTYQYGVYAEDFWGYFNGQYNNPHLIPNLPAPRVSANRTPDATYAQACILKKITYPTGGYTSFNYESNVTNDGSTGGGLRIQSITSQADAGSPPMTRRYEYFNNMLYSSMDSYNSYQYEGSSINVDQSTCFSWTNDATIYIATPVVPLVNHDGSPAVYQIVTEYADSASNSLKTQYTYQTEPDIVTSVEFPRYQDQYFTDRSWRKGLLGGIFYYKRNKDGTYQQVKSTNNVYGDYRTNTVIAGTLVAQAIPGPGTSSCFIDSYTPNTPFNQLFYYFDVMVEVGIKKLIQQSVAEFDDNNNSIVTTTNYTYGSPYHLYPTSIDYTNSKGDKSTTIIKYPNDFAGTAVYDALIARNTIAPTIQKLKYKNDNTFLQSSQVNYSDWGNNILAQETLQTQEAGAPVQTRIRYSAYDAKGNIVSVAREGDVVTSYIWGYNQAYPVAKVMNAAAKDVFYTSFEDASGNSADGDSKTGRKSTTSGLQASLSNLSNGTYLLTYWQKSGGVWGYQSTTVTVTNGSYSINLSGQLDEVRFYPAGAQMITYTYDPLIGMTSQCDINNLVTYFEYDSFGRLVRTRDKDKNILKQFDYQYQTAVGFFNTDQRGTYTRSNCGVNFRGTPVTYTVPTGAYTSSLSVDDANTKAVNDVTANGQAYADAHGSCVPTNIFYNVDKFGLYTRNNCSSGYVGTQLIYEVVAGIYTSYVSQDIVDNQAQADVDNNGQAYANAHGSCILPIVNVNCTNFTSQGFHATYTNVSTGTSYTFSIDPNITSAVLGQIPFGTYNVTITPTGGSALFDFDIYSYSTAGVTSMTANGIVFGCDCGAIQIDTH
jgi:hypothetical protein